MSVKSRRIIVSTLSLWTAFSLVSLLSSGFVNDVDYAAYQYGFPFTWLVHQVAGISPFEYNLWTFIWYNALLDFSLWLGISLVISIVFSKAKHFFKMVFPIVVSIPFLTILSFDSLLIVIGLIILAVGLVGTILERGPNNHEIIIRNAELPSNEPRA